MAIDHAEARRVLFGEWVYTEDKEFARQLYPFIAEMPMGWQGTVSILLYMMLVRVVVAAGLCGITSWILGEFIWRWPAFAGQLHHIWTAGIVLFGIMLLLSRPFHRFRLCDWQAEHMRKDARLWQQLLIALILCLPLALATTATPWSFLWPPMLLFAVFSMVLMGLVGVLGLLGMRIAIWPFADSEAIEKPNDVYPRGRIWWVKRPLLTELETAMREVVDMRKGWKKRFQQIDLLRANPPDRRTLFELLLNGGWSQRFIGRQVAATLGGEMVPSLSVYATRWHTTQQQAIQWVLTNIARETTVRLAPGMAELACPTCHYRPTPVPVPNYTSARLRYVGCRQCGQSRTFRAVREIVAILDRTMTEPETLTDGILRVNWHQRDGLVDFDRVEIINATDFDVEHFCIEVGNDTDDWRAPRYATMPVTIAPACDLAENTLRMLHRLFPGMETP